MITLMAMNCNIKGCESARISRWRCANHSVRKVITQCSVDDCIKKHYGQGLCQMHWARLSVRGEVGGSESERPGNRVCDADECLEKHFSKGYCRKHYERVRVHGDPNIVKIFVPEALPGAQNANWRGDDAGYHAVHVRLRVERGPARERCCADCGSSADQWSYDKRDHRGLESPQGWPYSTNLEHYQARCFSCHSKFDRID